MFKPNQQLKVENKVENTKLPNGARTTVCWLTNLWAPYSKCKRCRSLKEQHCLSAPILLRHHWQRPLVHISATPTGSDRTALSDALSGEDLRFTEHYIHWHVAELGWNFKAQTFMPNLRGRLWNKSIGLVRYAVSQHITQFYLDFQFYT